MGRLSETSWTCDTNCNSIITKMGHEPQSDPPRRWYKIYVAAVDGNGNGNEITVYACELTGHLEKGVRHAVEWTQR